LSQQIGADAKNDLIKSLKSRLLEESASELVKETFNRITAQVNAETKANTAHTHFEAFRQRLLNEIESLGRRGNINLGLGVGTTVIGMLLLGITVFYEITDTKDAWGLLAHFLPRFSLVILIELFAYFFLSLYKTGLDEIKYFQNELTNIEAKQISLQTALNSNDTSMVNSVVIKFANTERNHILNKDQTTIELEKAKMEKESKVAIGNFLTEFFNKSKPSP
jgi:predicted PurR-regulated permease PerM